MKLMQPFKSYPLETKRVTTRADDDDDADDEADDDEARGRRRRHDHYVSTMLRRLHNKHKTIYFEITIVDR